MAHAWTARTQPAWRKTMLGAVEWSYHLLSEPERVLLARLLPLRAAGRWRPPKQFAATEIKPVAGASSTCCWGWSTVPWWRWMPTGRRPVIVFSIPFVITPTRSWRNAAGGPPVSNRHLAWFSAWASQMAAQLDQAAPREVRQRVEQEHNNLRAALDWGLNPQACLDDRLFWWLRWE